LTPAPSKRPREPALGGLFLVWVFRFLQNFRKLRAENHELLKALPDEAFSRTGNHTESGPLTLMDLVKGNAEHVEEHVQQIQRTRAAYKEHRAKQAAQAPAQP